MGGPGRRLGLLPLRDRLRLGQTGGENAGGGVPACLQGPAVIGGGNVPIGKGAVHIIADGGGKDPIGQFHVDAGGCRILHRLVGCGQVVQPESAGGLPLARGKPQPGDLLGSGGDGQEEMPPALKVQNNGVRSRYGGLRVLLQLLPGGRLGRGCVGHIKENGHLMAGAVAVDPKAQIFFPGGQVQISGQSGKAVLPRLIIQL